MFEELLNKSVIVRSQLAGVFVGTLEEVNGETVKLSNARNIWKWEGAACLIQISLEGLRGGKVSQIVPSIVINAVGEILPLTETAVVSINRIPEWRI